MKELLNKIEAGVPNEVKSGLSKRTASGWFQLSDLSKSLSQLVNRNVEIREILFKNNNNCLPYSGDILSVSLFEHWVTRGDIEEIFKKHAENTYSYAGVDFSW